MRCISSIPTNKNRCVIYDFCVWQPTMEHLFLCARVVYSFELTKRRRSECTTDLTHPERESVFSCLDCDHLRSAAARIMQLHTAHTMEFLRTFSSYCRIRALASIWRNDTHALPSPPETSIEIESLSRGSRRAQHIISRLGRIHW